MVSFSLNEHNDKIRITCFIKKQYQHLVTDESKFYRVSGISVYGSLRGVSIKTESIESLVSGGIAFFTEPSDDPVLTIKTFSLFNTLEDSRSDKQPEITVKFDYADQLYLGAPVKIQGIEVGTVSDIKFDSDLKSIIVELKINQIFETFFRKETQIWLTSPTVNLSGVKNLDTVLFGASIAVHPGTGEITHEFTGSDKPPQFLFPKNSGINIVLETKHLGSIDIGTPVYYRQVQIGQVTGYNLAADFKDVFIYISIDKEYSAIVRENTQFWNVSGIKVSGGVFSGITVSTQSLQAIMTGGIALATPGKEEMGAPAYDGYHFILHDKAEPSWTDWNPDIFVVEGESPEKTKK